jgi:hypothetical protein
MPLSPLAQDKLHSRGLEKMNGSLEGGSEILNKLKELRQEGVDSGSSWQVPLPVQYKTLALKEILASELKDDPRFSLESLEKHNKSKESAENGKVDQKNEQQKMLTLFWERDEYRWTSLSEADELEMDEPKEPLSSSETSEDWPWFVRHEKLETVGAQIPDVPGVRKAPREPYNRMTRKLFKQYAKSPFDGLKKELPKKKL